MRKLDKYCKILCSRLQPVLQYIRIHSEPASDQMASLDFIEDIADFPEIFCISMLMKIRKAELDDHKQAVVSVMCKESERLGRFC